MSPRIVTQYQVVRNHNQPAFQESCDHLLEAGWQPFGGVAIQATGEWVELAQAFVKYAQ